MPNICLNNNLNLHPQTCVFLIHLQQFVFLCNYVYPRQYFWKKDEHNFPHFQRGLDKEFINATSSSDTCPFSKAFIHLIKVVSLFLCIKFNLILWGKHLLNHGTLKQCKPRSPTSSFATGSSCKKITG